MRFLQMGISSVVLVSLASCSTLSADGKRIDYGAAATKVPALEVPPDLTVPAGDERYKVPQGEAGATTPGPSAGSAQAPLNGAEGVATYSDYSKGGTQDRAVGGVLPVVQGVHMEHNNAERWLVINENAEIVWPEVKAFWQETGLAISSEDQAAGVMETVWAENRAKISKGGSPNDSNEAFNNAYAAGERDQYRTRLEHDKDGVSTDVYITHRGIKEESSGKGTTQWVARPSDPGLEAIILQRLMVRFGINEAKATSEVAATGASVPGATALKVIEPAGLASLREAGGSVIIVLNDPFDRSWRKVGLALESAGLVVEDKDREKGVYYLRPVRLDRSWLDKLKFWKSNEDTTSHYRVNVKDGGASCEVSILDQNGASNKISKQMLEAIYKNINQQQ